MRLEVPQATLERTREIVDAIAKGAVDRAGIAEKSGVALRQVSYGIASARVLGLLDGDEPFVLTEVGRALAATEAGGAEEATVLRHAIEASETLRAVAPGLAGETPPLREAVIERIRELGGLADNTAAHRAGMLFGWRKRLTEARDPREVKERLLGARWRRIDVRRFRSLEHLTLDIGPLTVVHGPTGSGKSNVADALLFAHELALDAGAALGKRGGLRDVLRHGVGPVELEERLAATREALEHSYRRHRVSLGEDHAGGWSIVEEQWDVVHEGVPLVTATRADGVVHFGDEPAIVRHDESMLDSAVGQRALGRHVAVRAAFRLTLDDASLLAPCAGAEARMLPDGSRIACAVRRLQESRSYPGLLETLRNIVPGLADLVVDDDADGCATLSAMQTLGPGVLAKLTMRSWSRGTRIALGVLVAAHQLTNDEAIVVELDELALDAASLALAVDVLVAASRRATVILTTADEELAQSINADVHVHCRFRGGRTEVAAPGLRLV